MKNFVKLKRIKNWKRIENRQIRVSSQGFRTTVYPELRLTERKSPMFKIFKMMKFEYNIDLLWSYKIFGKVSGFPTRAIVPEKAPFCSLRNFQKSTFDLRSTQNYKQDRLKKIQIRSSEGNSRKTGSYSSQDPGVSTAQIGRAHV